VIHELELRLIGAAAPDGEVRLNDLAELAAGLQELSLRVGRELHRRAGPGRTHQTVEALTEMRLSGLSKGSTRLHLARGGEDELDLDLVQAREIDTKFWEVVEGVRTNERPEWVTDLIAESAGKLVMALKSSAPQVELVRGDNPPMRLETQTLRKEVWLATPDDRAAEEVVVTGILEAVDLRSGRFRIRDDVGTRIALDDVVDRDSVAPLINHRVRAVGVGVLGPEGQLKAVTEPSIEQESLPDSWSKFATGDWSAELSKPGPAFGEGVELSDEEFADLMAVLKG